jgi:hypothetical protein
LSEQLGYMLLQEKIIKCKSQWTINSTHSLCKQYKLPCSIHFAPYDSLILQCVKVTEMWSGNLVVWTALRCTQFWCTLLLVGQQLFNLQRNPEILYGIIPWQILNSWSLVGTCPNIFIQNTMQRSLSRGHWIVTWKLVILSFVWIVNVI